MTDTMKIFPTTEVEIRWDVVATVDLTSATARALIDGEWHNLTWVTASAVVPDSLNFTRTAALEVGGAESTAAVKMTYRQEPLVEVAVNGHKLVTSTFMVGVY